MFENLNLFNRKQPVLIPAVQIRAGLTSEIALYAEKAAASLFNSLKCTHYIAKKDFSDVNVKDVFKVALTDVTSPEMLYNLSIPFNRNEVFTGDEFAHLKNTCFYSFVIRTPFLKKYPFCALSDKHFREIYTYAEQRGAENSFSVIEQDMNTMLKIQHNNGVEPPFDAEWFRRWIYACCKPLAVVNNRNMFLLGCADTLFPLYYAALTEKIIKLFS